MATPTLVQTAGNTWTTLLGTTRVASSISWQAGDIIIAVGATEFNNFTLGTPTGTGLSFSAISGFPSNSSNTCKIYAWIATPGSSGTSNVTSTAGNDEMSNIQVFVFRGSTGLGATALSVSGTTNTINLTRTGVDSAVVFIAGDFSVTNDTTVTPVPSTNGTQRQAARASGRATMFCMSWSDQGATGTTAYGITGFSTSGPLSRAAIEIKGTASPANPAAFLQFF